MFYKLSFPLWCMQCLKVEPAVALMVFYKFSDTVSACFILPLVDVCSCSLRVNNSLSPTSMLALAPLPSCACKLLAGLLLESSARLGWCHRCVNKLRLACFCRTAQTLTEETHNKNETKQNKPSTT